MKRAVLALAAILTIALLIGWTLTISRPPVASPQRQVAKPAPLPGRVGDRLAVAATPIPTGGQAIQSMLNIRTPMTYGEHRWDDAGVPAGPVWIRIDLHDQILSVFRAGHEIGTAVVLYGADAKPTPIGTFPIIARLKDHRSSAYDAPMPYTLRLTPDGVAIHGSNVRWGAATHGCIGVPTDFAAKLFDQVAVGTPVTIVGDTRPAAVPATHS